MPYDRDIQTQRHLMLALIVVNLGLAAWALYKGDWSLSAAFGVWAVNLLVMRHGLKASQKTRDEARLMRSMLTQDL
jgi:hypothetical protein